MNYSMHHETPSSMRYTMPTIPATERQYQLTESEPRCFAIVFWSKSRSKRETQQDLYVNTFDVGLNLVELCTLQFCKNSANRVWKTRMFVLNFKRNIVRITNPPHRIGQRHHLCIQTVCMSFRMVYLVFWMALLVF